MYTPLNEAGTARAVLTKTLPARELVQQKVKPIERLPLVALPATRLKHHQQE